MFVVRMPIALRGASSAAKPERSSSATSVSGSA
jgi:hypothetical protein